MIPPLFLPPLFSANQIVPFIPVPRRFPSAADTMIIASITHIMEFFLTETPLTPTAYDPYRSITPRLVHNRNSRPPQGLRII